MLVGYKRVFEFDTSPSVTVQQTVNFWTVLKDGFLRLF